MSSKILVIARKLIRGTRSHMEQILLTAGGVLMPLGFYLTIERPQVGILGVVFVLLGVGFWLCSYWFARFKRQEEKQERTEREIWLHRELQELHQLLANIDKELQRLNKDKELKS